MLVSPSSLSLGAAAAAELGVRQQTPSEVHVGTLRFLPFFLSAVILASLGCARDSTPPKADVAVGKKDVAKKEANNGTTNAATDSRDAALRKELKNLLQGRKRPDGNVMSQRMGTSTLPEANGWKEALQALQPDLDKKQAAFLMFEMDPLYREDGTFLPDDSAKYRRRLKSVPQPAIKTWSGRLEGASEVTAAIMLIQIDTLFDNDQFQSSRLDSALRILKELKENK